MSFADWVQLAGAVFILAGYWFMARKPALSALLLIVGCAVWAWWATLIHPFAYWLFGLELILGGMSARTFFLTWRPL